MKKISSYVTILISCVFLLTSFAMAGSKAHAARKRQHHQERRIQQGLKSGELTTDEAKKLHKEQHAVRKARKAAAKDGQVTREEKKEIKQMQDQNSQDIHEEKTDAENDLPK